METRQKSKDLEKLKIVPIQEEEQEGKIKRNLHPNLPNVYRGQLITIVAPIRSGKSVTWNNMLLNDNFYNDLFPNDGVTIISILLQATVHHALHIKNINIIVTKFIVIKLSRI